MTAKSFKTGLIGGVLMSLGSLYPVMALLVPDIVGPGWTPLVSNGVVHALLLLVSALIALPTLTLIGPGAAFRVRARSVWEGMRAGMLTGAVAGVVFFIGIVSPVNALGALLQFLAEYYPTPTSPWPEDAALIAFANGTLHNVTVYFLATIGLAITIAGLGGGLVGLVQRTLPMPVRPTLFGLLDSGDETSRYFLAGEEQPMTVGLVVGLAIGAIAGLSSWQQFYIGVLADSPRLADLLRDQLPRVVITSNVVSNNIILPIVLGVSLLLMGAIVIGSIKNPPTRYESRIAAVVLAANIAFLPLLLSEMHVLYFNLGFLPYYMFDINALIAEGLQLDYVPVASVSMAITSSVLSKPALVVLVVFLAPWVIFTGLAVFWTLAAVLQALFYTAIFSSFRKAPVDIAGDIYGRLEKQPDAVLPTIYGLFNRYEHAYDILGHLVVESQGRNLDLARVAAALHTLGLSHDEDTHTRMAREVRDVVGARPDWRWHNEIGDMHRSMVGVLEARTVEQICNLTPPKPPETTTLPPLLVKATNFIIGAVNELHKMLRTDDLATQMIFLENGLQMVGQAERIVSNERADQQAIRASAPLPEQRALATALGHWQDVVLQSIQRLKGRADIVIELKSRTSPEAARTMVVAELRNQGLNVAQSVRVTLLPGDDYDIVGEPTCDVDMLSPNEVCDLTFEVAATGAAHRLRLAWEVRYDDAMDADRTLSFGDIMELVTPDKPFERIFPVPYVTGTPLKTDDVFVGRDEVFAFIRENLVGAYQNNVVILHGQRRTGKTSVLYRLARLLGDTHFGVLIDMQGKPARGVADFLYAIADDIVFALEEHGVDVELPPREAFADSPEFFFRSRFLRGLRDKLGDRHLLLLFDEFEEIQRRVEDGHLQPEIFQFLRNLMQHEVHVDFVFSGTHKLEELGAEYWSVLFNIAVYMPITFLSRADVRQLILEPVAGYNIEYDPLAIDRIYQVTAGHPYFAQLVLHEMIVYHNETERSYHTVADVNAVLERIVERGEAHFKYIWAEASTDEKYVLQGLAEILVGRENTTVKDLAAHLTARGCVSDDDWAQALAGLERRDIITRRTAKSPLYRFKVDLVRLWIDRTRPPL